MSEQTTIKEAVPEWDLPDRMRKALRHSDVGVQQMADYLDVSRSAVGKWINGHITPSTQTVRLWALRCGVPYTWLKDGIEANPTGPNGGSEQGEPSTWGYPRRTAKVVALPVHKQAA